MRSQLGGGLDAGRGGWRGELEFDPLPALLHSHNPTIQYFARRDLLGQEKEQPAIEELWRLPEVRRAEGNQLGSGAWKYHGGTERIRSAEDYNQLETYRVLGHLVEKYGLTRRHPAVEAAAGYLFSHQTEEGDFRGIYGKQYTPNYSAAIMELLIKAGYGGDPRVEKGFRWLLSIRQTDGGWAIPLRTVDRNFDSGTLQGETIRPDTPKPFSHLVTGVVLRAFAAHQEYRGSKEARAAGKLLASRFFEPDRYPDRHDVGFWTSFSYPFWFTDILSSLDSLSTMGMRPEDPKIRRALDWFTRRQRKDGRWSLSLLRMTGERERDLWIGLAICRVFKRLYG